MRAIILLSVAFIGATTAATNYCEVCKNHTMCLYKGPSDQCKSLTYRAFTDAEKSAILDAHNKLRNQIAAGQVEQGKSGKQPAAADMRKLSWDDEIALIAQRWALQCTFDHDECRNSADKTEVGQNILVTWDISSSLSALMESAVNDWFSEVKDFDGEKAGKPFQFDASTGHYTQIAWAKTSKVGCGWSEYAANGGGRNRLIVCNYKESGNFIGSNMYTVGTPASACGNEGRDSTYTSLCA